MKETMKNLLVVCAVSLLVAATAQATVVLSDNFDDSTNGALTGQNADTGQTWGAWGSYASTDVGAAYGRTGKGIGMSNDWSDRLNKISLGTTLTGGVAEDVVVLSFDAERGSTGEWGAATSTRQNVRLTDTVSGNFIKVSWGDADATSGWLHKIEIMGLGLDTQLDAYRSGWLNFELSVNLTTGQTDLTWDNLDNSDGATYDLGTFDTSAYAFAPNEVGVHQRRVAVPTIGMDNLMVSTVPEPATMSLLGIGGLLALVRRRRK